MAGRNQFANAKQDIYAVGMIILEMLVAGYVSPDIAL